LSAASQTRGAVLGSSTSQPGESGKGLGIFRAPVIAVLVSSGISEKQQ